MVKRAGTFIETARKEMANPLSQAFLSVLPPGFAVMKQLSMSSFPDPAAAIELSKAIRQETLTRLPELLEEFEENALSNGARVFWAGDSAAANEYILNLCREKGAAFVTKGKSMITEETGLNSALEEGGIEVFETDLGEFITQQMGRPPFHIVGPAINIPAAEISEIFLEKGIISEPSNDAVALGKSVRAYLRDRFKSVKVGITGINMAVSSSGAIINVENEGNIRLTKSSPETLVAVMSIEKVVPDMNDALHILRILCRHCVGQKISGYVTIDTGPAKQSELDGPKELHIIILDNGRSEIYRDSLTRQALKCIRCGACLNICPVYSKIGGYPYGFAYSGPMGQMLNPLFLGFHRTKDLFSACTLCGACRDACPAGIDHPGLFLYYRSLIAENADQKEKALYASAAAAMQSGLAWRLGIKTARAILNRNARDGYVSSISGIKKGWFSNRDLPEIAKKTFHELWKELNRKDT
ncbi:MAG TPA: LUD domain-containing protein [Desulfomonilia bacterium]